MTKDNDIPYEDPQMPLFNFCQNLSPEDKEVFFKSLSEQEKIDYSSSLEEFRQVFDRYPELDYPTAKPDFQKDVDYSEVKADRIKERYDEIKKTFPQDKSIAGIQEKAKQLNEDKGKGMLKSIDDLKKIKPKIQISIY